MRATVVVKGSRPGKSVCGRDVGVFVRQDDGSLRLLPVRSFVMRVAGRHEPVILEMEMEASEVQVCDVEAEIE